MEESRNGIDYTFVYMEILLLPSLNKSYESPSLKYISFASRSRILSGSLSFGSSGKAGNDIIDNEYEEAF